MSITVNYYYYLYLILVFLPICHSKVWGQ